MMDEVKEFECPSDYVQTFMKLMHEFEHLGGLDGLQDSLNQMNAMIALLQKETALQPWSACAAVRLAMIVMTWPACAFARTTWLGLSLYARCITFPMRLALRVMLSALA